MLRRFCCALLLAGLLAAESASKLNIYCFNLPDIHGKMISFDQFKGKVLLVVNVASNSSYTLQYAGLEDLYQHYRAAGLVVLGFPSNDFGGQEPDSEEKIASFCNSNYHVTFPLFSKLEVRGENITPLFAYLTKEANPKLKGDVHWNFTKLVVDRKGQLAGRFEPDVTPDDPELIVAIENALAGKTVPNPSTPPAPPADSSRRRTPDGE